MSRNTLRNPCGLVLFAVACVALFLLSAVGASAESLPTPIMTVTDTRIQPCGAVALTGSSFAPNTKLTMVLGGKTLAEQPATDERGNFAFTTSVSCEQRTGSVQVKASDGTSTVGVEVAIGAAESAKASTPVVEAETTRTDRLGLWAVRAALLMVMIGEIALLVTRRRNRAQRLRPASTR